MTAQIAIYGRLGRDPEERQSQSGKAWSTASIAVDIGRDDHDPPMWFGLVAFGKKSETLCRHVKGDLISVSGRLQTNRWTDRDGHEREQLQVTVDAVVSARTVRPSGGKKRQNPDQSSPDPRSSGGDPQLNDDIPFGPEVRI